MVYVTHDQVEAMTLGDRIAVFNQGRIEQVAAPMELYENPATEFVAGFIGSPRMNLLDAEPLRRHAIARGEDEAWSWVRGSPASAHRLGLRPDRVHVAPAGQGMAAQLVHAEHLGDCSILHARLEDVPTTLVAKTTQTKRGLRAGDKLHLVADPTATLAFDSSGARIHAKSETV
jgi:multiple sugar transport system ATP-binding protein